MAAVKPIVAPQKEPRPRSIVLYDGSCGLCHKSVNWILRHERDHQLHFAPLQGPTATGLRIAHPEIPSIMESVVFVDGERVWLRSKAILHLARHLRAPWRWLYRMRWLPAFILDLGYRAVARVRYRIWGRADVCSLPSLDQRARFLP